ncbi:TfoX/Sxy family DNA transformation protein [Pleionea sediminis]|uniref:TfoX/Sxy family DNA transformation protein n=1 Tax=Pleionea sediminis TaxID=2569479 RepID=UPI00118615E9|nr:TfoX/Sxy family DNA transformation protein [Pleionea sediminis]
MDAKITELKNLGPKSAKLLRGVGINSRSELESLGCIAAYKLLQAAEEKISLNLLYAMYGALHDIHWAQLPESVKHDLIAAVQSSESPFK